MGPIPDHEKIINYIAEHYWMSIDEYLLENPHLIKSAPGFLILPEKVILYLGETHLAIEYLGPERVSELPNDLRINIQYHDLVDAGDKFLEKIIGFNYTDSTSKSINFPIPTFSEGLIMPTNRGADKLEELKWSIGAQDGMTVFNSNRPVLFENEYTRIINGLFFDADEKGLRTRHIKWMDFIPVIPQKVESDGQAFQVNLGVYNKKLAEQDCNYSYPIPEDYDYQTSKLQKINRFLELVANDETSETEITRFLSQKENHFILKMRFGAVSIFSEIQCEWQSENKPDIRPDFFLQSTNGFSDIVEFKLPTAEIEVVGRLNRETLSAQINSYISQTRTYRNYFEDPNNRKWLEKNHGVKVYRPRRYLIIGRRWMFNNDTWREIISDYQDLEILSYDDLIDGVVAQLYI